MIVANGSFVGWERGGEGRGGEGGEGGGKAIP